MPKLAQRMGRAKPSAIMQIVEKTRQMKAAGREVISFSIGVPNFLPGPHVYAAAREALEHDSGQYGSNRGPDALLDAFLKHIGAAGLTGYQRKHCATGIGAKHILYNLAEALLDPGDEIVFPSPYWTTYADIAEIVGARATALPCPASQNYKLTPRSRAGPRCSCSTIRPTRPAWSTAAKRSPPSPTWWRGIPTSG
jgi:aspartate aminotransferase